MCSTTHDSEEEASNVVSLFKQADEAVQESEKFWISCAQCGSPAFRVVSFDQEIFSLECMGCEYVITSLSVQPVGE